MKNLSLAFSYLESDSEIGQWVDQSMVEVRPRWIDGHFYMLLSGGKCVDDLYMTIYVRRASLFDIARYLVRRASGRVYSYKRYKAEIEHKRRSKTEAI